MMIVRTICAFGQNHHPHALGGEAAAPVVRHGEGVDKLPDRVGVNRDDLA